MDMATHNPHRTAISRRRASIPARWAMTNLSPQGKVLDFGCGRGADVTAMLIHGWRAEGYDPYWQPDMPRAPFALVICNYVLNVVTIDVRAEILQTIHGLLDDGGQVFLSTRSDREIERVRKDTWEPHEDGWITPQGTFQHGLDCEELAQILTGAGFEIEKVWAKRDTTFALANKP